jgi:hypothetical protein
MEMKRNIRESVVRGVKILRWKRREKGAVVVVVFDTQIVNLFSRAKLILFFLVATTISSP